MRLEHWTIRYSQPSLHKEDGEERYFDPQRPGCPGKGDIWVLPILLLRINKSPDLKQPHPDAPAPHFSLWDEGLLVCDPQLRSHVEACCFPRTHHFRANHDGLQKEMNTGTYPYSTLIHQLSQPMITFNHQLYGVVPVTSPERNSDKF